MLDCSPVGTLPEALARAARDFPGRGIGLLDARGRGAELHPYPELLEAAAAIADRLARRGTAEREPVVIALPTSWDWLRCWWGAALRGAYPLATSAGTTMAAAEAQRAKLEQVTEHVGARTIIAHGGFRDRLLASGQGALADTVITPEELDRLPPARFGRAPADPGDAAFLQLTSGSTGRPRAVMIPHRAAVHNPLASCEAIGKPLGEPIHRLTEAMVSWLPLYHDMGLIGCMMLPLLTGLDGWLLRPEAFLARPMLWLSNLAARGATFAPAPNFAYQLCVERIPEEVARTLDLSGWRAALTGAEMVRMETALAFCERFAAARLTPETLRPCYGLAECTLAVTFDARGKGVRGRLPPPGDGAPLEVGEVVCNGEPIRDTRVEIRGPNGAALGEDRIGEVCVSGPGVFLGYYRDEEATAECFDGTWLHTGDLGFLSDGELYLTGRLKDLLIIRGLNLMPEELERVADAVTGGGGLQRSAAFSVSRGPAGEEAVLVVETLERDPDLLRELERSIRLAIADRVGLPLADLAFVRRGRIPRTSSGKMQRTALRQQYLANALERM